MAIRNIEPILIASKNTLFQLPLELTLSSVIEHRLSKGGGGEIVIMISIKISPITFSQNWQKHTRTIGECNDFFFVKVWGCMFPW